MINIIVGKPGEGKTYLLTRLAIKFLKQGRDVYSNYFIDYDKIFKIKNDSLGHLHYWVSVSELVNLRSGIVLIDECQIYFNSRKWKNLPEQLQYKFHLQTNKHCQ